MKTDDKPPAAPKTATRISLTAKQIVGIPLIAAVPLLAVLGVFGERATTTVVRSGNIEASVTFPTRIRYRQVESLHVEIRNMSRDSIDALVRFDTAYVTRFSSVHFEPALSSAYVVPVTRLAPGASGLVSVEFSGDQYGRHRGNIIVVANGDSVSVPIATVVFP